MDPDTVIINRSPVILIYKYHDNVLKSIYRSQKMQNIPSQQPQINPLSGLMRQPKIYIKLPSKGNYWPEGSLKVSANEEYAVYSMTAKDELILKTPDALLNGQAVVDVVQSCIPSVLNAWELPQTDVDALLIAIRIATYGEVMETTITEKGCEATYGVDLRNILDNLINNLEWDERVEIGDNLVVYVRPLNYRQLAKSAQESFETQRIINLVNDEKLAEDRKIELFKESFSKLSQLTLDSVADSIYRVDTSVGTVTDSKFIKEFVEQCDRSMFNQIKSHIDRMRERNAIKPMRVKATEEMVLAGSAEEIEVPILFDPTTFFK